MATKIVPILALAATAFGANGFVKLDFVQEYVTGPILKRDIPPADLDENITLAIQQTVYWLDLSIGSPPQPLRLQLDTGSSNLWVPAANATNCVAQNGCPGGDFDLEASSTFQVTVPGAFQIAYGDGTNDAGDYFTDTVTVGESVLDTGIMTMGLAIEINDGPSLPNDGHGLVGVGYLANMAGLEYTITENYVPPTLIQAMVQNGDIEREAYSLYLNSLGSGTGSIIFSGVDTAKYQGDLVALQILQTTNNPYSNYSELSVALTGISITDNSGTRLLTDSTFSTPALIDSGTVSQDLPTGVYNAISQGFGVTQGFVPCSYASSKAAIVYHFGGEGGPSISVPLGALMFPADGTTFQDGTEACYLGVGAADDNGVILGDSFMRSGYFVFDLENNIVAMAQAAINATEESITAIPSGTEIPGCTSTNTLTLAASGSITTPVDTMTPTATATDFVVGTPTFALGEATGSPTASATGGSGSSDSGAMLNKANSGVAMLISLAAGIFALA